MEKRQQRAKKRRQQAQEKREKDKVRQKVCCDYFLYLSSCEILNYWLKALCFNLKKNLMHLQSTIYDFSYNN